ncbi:MAG: transcription antitermination factor NusB [Bacilli bacterium]|nr:transcription antitermination factor NusB [Bacilli bacterium]
MDENKDLTRKEQREEIIKLLYAFDITTENPELEEVVEYVRESVLGVIEHKDKIDEILVVNLQKWKLNRLSFVDRAIMRFAVYELYYTSTPFEIVINEALNLTRKYSDEGDNKTVGFINKVLDNIKIYLKK